MSTGINAVVWWTSPACARMLEHLECHGESTPERIARDCHVTEHYTLAIGRILKEAKRVHVSAWRHNANGRPTPVYRLGPGRNVPQPKPETASQRAKRRRASLVELYGARATNVILRQTRKPGTIIVGGKAIRAGDHDGQLVGKISRR